MDFFDVVVSWIAIPFGYLLRLCYLLIQNYGFAIVLFTLFTKFILLPVSLLVQKNSIKMVKMKPELDALKCKYTDDKDAYLDEQVALYKREKYKPFAGVIPLLIQIPIIFGLIDVIYKPLKYVLLLSQDIIAEFTRIAASFGDLGYSPELRIVELLADPANREVFMQASGQFSSAEVSSAIDSISRMQLDFFGISLSSIPSFAWNLLLLVPVLAGVSAWLLCYFQNRVNVLQAEQNKLSQWGMTIFMICFSTFFAFVVPAGVGIYWIAGNLFAIPFLYLVNLIYNPKKFIDYKYLETMKKILLEKKEKEKLYKKRSSRDYKRFCKDETQENMKIMFFSEQSGFYKYFKNLIEAIINNSDVVVHYVTNDPNDVVFTFDNPQLVPYYVNEKKIIPLMMKVEADIVVMTVPDLEKYYIKKSRVRKDVEYIYTDHGVTSLNLTYRPGALDHFTTIFAVNKSQVAEIRAMEKLRHTPRKNILECGYGLIDNMIREYQALPKAENEKKTILIAPSWQEDNILDSCLDPMLENLLGREDYRVIVRPHPQYIRRFPINMEMILEKYKDRFSEDFAIETDFSSNVTVYTADLVITDWSSIGYEFTFATDKPALFINTKIKAINPDWEKIDVVPFEIEARNKIAKSIDKEEVSEIDRAVEELFEKREEYAEKIRDMKENFFFNIGHSGEFGAKYILARLAQNAKKKRSVK